jgi:hypothetical protein
VTAGYLEDLVERHSEASPPVTAGRDIAVVQLAQLVNGLRECCCSPPGRLTYPPRRRSVGLPGPVGMRILAGCRLCLVSRLDSQLGSLKVVGGSAPDLLVDAVLEMRNDAELRQAGNGQRHGPRARREH